MKNTNPGIVHLYNNIYSHIRWARTTQWQVAAVVMGLLSAHGAIALAGKIKHQAFDVLLCLSSIAFTIYGIWHLASLQTELTGARELRRRIEREVFKFHEVNLLTRRSLMPMLKDEPVSWAFDMPRLISWWVAMILAAVYVNILIFVKS